MNPKVKKALVVGAAVVATVVVVKVVVASIGTAIVAGAAVGGGYMLYKKYKEVKNKEVVHQVASQDNSFYKPARTAAKDAEFMFTSNSQREM